MKQKPKHCRKQQILSKKISLSCFITLVLGTIEKSKNGNCTFGPTCNKLEENSYLKKN